jgi:hypothetical protein
MGRPKGSLNKATLERIERAKTEQQRQAKLDEAKANAAVEVVQAAAATRKPLARDVLDELMLLFRAHAELYRLPPPGQPPNPNADEQKFWKYGMAAAQIARDLAQYQSPKLSAVAVGPVQRKVVHVIGGLPPRRTTPLPAIAPPATENSTLTPTSGVAAAGRSLLERERE